MKKQGFTLSELLIAIGIIAIASTAVVPFFKDITPDKNKIKVINYYNKINEVNQKLLNNKSLFKTVQSYNNDKGEIEVEYFGFADVQLPIDWSDLKNELNWEGGEPVGQNSKYSQFFMYTLTGSTKYTKAILNDGATITIKNDYLNTNVKPNTIKFSIDVDIDGTSKGKNCSYNSKCKYPDIFKFKVDESGAVTAGDAMTDAYLSTMEKPNNQKADKELAKKYLKSRSY